MQGCARMQGAPIIPPDTDPCKQLSATGRFGASDRASVRDPAQPLHRERGVQSIRIGGAASCVKPCTGMKKAIGYTNGYKANPASS
jgi:hypothetical protein